MIAEREGSVALVAIAAIGIDCPASENGAPNTAEVAHHGGINNVGRAEQHFAFGCSSFVAFVRGKALTELLINAGEFKHRSVEHERKTGVSKAAEQFLTF